MEIRNAQSLLEDYYSKVNSITEIQELATPILKDYGVIKASLFGSFAKGKQTNSSDIDFLIWLDLETHNKIGYFYIINLQQILENVLQRNVDILLYQELGSLKEEILKTQYILFDNL
jgi:uncharacterized protein